MPLSAAKIEDDTLANGCSVTRQMSFIFFYLLLSSFISFYLHLSPSIFIYLPLSTRQAELAKLKLYNINNGRKMRFSFFICNFAVRTRISTNELHQSHTGTGEAEDTAG
jgi:hypothetical protein